ncbi:MAG: sugar phosphate isomerase/epimerase [Turicibacter sp.]|nr:sugar phosphate isomerase/epimerase [Turicibacter sp.]
MKIGVRGHDYGRKTAFELASHIKADGFNCLQLAPTKAILGIEKFNEITAAHLSDIEKAFKDLEISVLGCYIEPSIQDKEQRLANVETFCDNIRHARALGIKIVGTETTRLDPDTPDDIRSESYALLKDSVLRMIEAAERENVFVGIEPVADHVLNTPALARRLLDEVQSNKLKIIFDPVNLVLPDTIFSQIDIFEETFDLLGDQLEVMHIKDVIMENDEKIWRNIGTGDIDYPFIFAWLKENKPNIPLLREGIQPTSAQEDLTAIKSFLE